MTKKLKKISKKFFKEINKLRKIDEVIKLATIKAIKKIILEDSEIKGESILTFILSDFENNDTLKYIVEKSSFKDYINSRKIFDKTLDSPIIFSAANRIKLDQNSFYDFIMTSILCEELINLSQKNKIEEFLNGGAWTNTALQKYMFFHSTSSFQDEKTRIQTFFSLTPLMLSNHSNIPYWISRILKFNNIPKEYHVNLKKCYEFISRSNIGPEGDFQNESTIKLLEIIVQSYLKDETIDEPIYWVVKYLKKDIKLKDFINKISGYIDGHIEGKEFICIDKNTVFIWSMLIGKIVINNSDEYRGVFILILILTYKKIGKTLFDERYINYIRESIVESEHKNIFIAEMIGIFKERNQQNNLTKLEKMLWETDISETFVREKGSKEYIIFSRENNLEVAFMYMHAKKIMSFKNNEGIKRYIEITRGFLRDKPSDIISDLEICKIDNKPFDLEKLQEIFDDQNYLTHSPFLNKLLLTRYHGLSFKDNNHHILKNNMNKMLENAIAVNSKDTTGDIGEEIEGIKKIIKQMTSTENKRSSLVLEGLEGASSFIIANILGGSIWRKLNKIPTKVSKKAINIKPGINYFVNLFDFIFSLKSKDINVVKNIFIKMLDNNTKIFIYESHIEDLTNETISEDIINSDLTKMSAFTVQEEVKFIEMQNSKLWENQIYWLIMENVEKIFFLVKDSEIIFMKYVFFDELELKGIESKTIPSAKLIDGTLELNVGEYEY